MAWNYKLTTVAKANVSDAQFEINHLNAVEEVEDFVNSLGPKPDGIKCLVVESLNQRNFHCWARDDKGPDRYDLTHVVWSGGATVDTVIELLEHGAILSGFDLGGVKKDWTSGNQSVHYFRKIN
jgi:hypothetical protein